MEIGIDFDDTIRHYDGKNLYIMEGCIDTLQILQSRGYTFHIITARSGDIGDRDDIREVERVLASNNIRIESIVYTSGHNKGAFAKRAGCQYMVDDNPEFLDNCLANGVVPIHLTTYSKGPSLPGFIVAHSWYMIPEILPDDPLYS